MLLSTFSAGSSRGFGEFSVIPEINYIGISSAQSASGTSFAISPPTNTSQNDLLVVVALAGNSSSTWTVPSGWTEALDSTQRLIAWKKAGASEGSSTFTTSGSGVNQGYMLCYRNANFDVAGLVGASGGTPSAPSITLSSNKSVLGAFFGSRTDTGATFSTPTGFTALGADSDPTAPSTAIFHKLNVSSGVTGSVSCTETGGTNARGVLFGIKPQ